MGDGSIRSRISRNHRRYRKIAAHIVCNVECEKPTSAVEGSHNTLAGFTPHVGETLQNSG
jgi:hypothetical protein